MNPGRIIVEPCSRSSRSRPPGQEVRVSLASVVAGIGDQVTDLQLRVNGRQQVLAIQPQTSLLDALREYLGLTGTKKGCDQGACGACTVLVDGVRTLSCLTLAVQYEGREITTIEGVDHPLQESFVRNGMYCDQEL